MKSKLAARCHHVSTSGVQCGSPAAGNLRFCYFHQQSRSTAIRYYADAPFTAIEEDLPFFEDAHSIQIAIRQIASLLMQQKIEPKTAGLLLYSIQLALLNLKQLKAEKPHPAHIVVNLEKVEETLPRSAFKEPTPPQSASEAPQKPAPSERKRKKDDEPSSEEVQEQLEYLLCLGRHLNDPAGTVPKEEDFIRTTRALRAGELGDIGLLRRTIPIEKIPQALKELEEEKSQAESEAKSQVKSHTKSRANSDDRLPPGTIQGCTARRPQSERRHERRNVN
jgi:hypothetical protein